MVYFAILTTILTLILLKYSDGLGYIKYEEGVQIKDAPIQSEIKERIVFKKKDFTIEAKAGYNVTAKVLRQESYYLDSVSDVSSVDLALGWKKMSDEKYLKGISITQKGRFYYWHMEEPTLTIAEAISQSANTHIIYANESAEYVIKNIKNGEFVNIQGYLVDVSKEEWGGRKWSSSTSREDSGNGACEIIYAIYVKKVEPEDI